MLPGKIGPLVRLLNSSKAWVVAVAIAALVVLAALRLLPVEEAKDSIVMLVLALIAANTAEDVAAKLPSKPGETHTTNVITERLPPPPRLPTDTGDGHDKE